MAKMIFIAEHDASLRETLVKKISQLGYNVLDAENGDEALKEMNLNPVPGAIITAAAMPEKDGIELCQGVRRDHRLSKAPIIVIRDKTTDVEAFRKLGVEEFVSKPVNFQELSETLAILTRYGSRKNIPGKKKGPSQGMLALIVIAIAVAFLTYCILGMGRENKNTEKKSSRADVTAFSAAV